MGRRSLSRDEVVRLVSLIEDGHLSHCQVATVLGRTQSVVTRAYQRYRETLQYGRRPGQGRCRCTTAREDRAIGYSCLRRIRACPQELARQHQETTGRPVSRSTVRNRLIEAGLHCRRPAKVSALQARHRVDRRGCDNRYGQWRLPNWRYVMFSDECRISLEGNDDHERVYRRGGRRFAQDTTRSITPYGGGSIMVWAGIMADGRTDLVLIPPPGMSAQRYIDEILIPHVLPFRQRVGERFLLQQDNARPHVAGITQRFCQEHDIALLEHPACSPDLNPIEHAWDELKRRLRKLARKPRNVHELYIEARRIWNAMPQAYFRTLVSSMPSRCSEVRNARGGNTSY